MKTNRDGMSLCFDKIIFFNALISQFKGVKEEKTVALVYIPLIILKLFPIKATFFKNFNSSFSMFGQIIIQIGLSYYTK